MKTSKYIVRKNTPRYKINLVNLIDFKHELEIKNHILSIRKLPKGPTIELPNEIELKEEFAWLVGFYLSDGNKVKYCIGFSNCEKELILKSKRILEKYLNLIKNDWIAYIKTSKNDLERIKKQYKNLLKIEKVRVYFDKNARHDNIELRVNNVPLALIFLKILETSIESIIKDEKLTLSFLDGYEVGDGSVLVRKGLLYGICITVKDLKTKNILKEMFTRIYKIPPRTRKTKGSYEISYSNVNLMTEFILDGHFSSSQKKWKRLIKSYLKKEYTRSHIRYWKALNDKKLNVEELCKLTKRSHWAVRDAMKSDSNFGLIKINKGRIKNKPGPYHIFYSLTDKGKKLLNILKRFDKCGKKESNYNGRCRT